MAGAGARPFVDQKIAQRKVMLFSKSYVPECKEVKEVLEEFGMSADHYEFVELEKRQDVNQIENYFQILCLTNNRAVSITIIMDILFAWWLVWLFSSRQGHIYSLDKKIEEVERKVVEVFEGAQLREKRKLNIVVSNLPKSAKETLEGKKTRAFKTQWQKVITKVCSFCSMCVSPPQLKEFVQMRKEFETLIGVICMNPALTNTGR